MQSVGTCVWRAKVNYTLWPLLTAFCAGDVLLYEPILEEMETNSGARDLFLSQKPGHGTWSVPSGIELHLLHCR